MDFEKGNSYNEKCDSSFKWAVTEDDFFKLIFVEYKE